MGPTDTMGLGTMVGGIVLGLPAMAIGTVMGLVLPTTWGDRLTEALMPPSLRALGGGPCSSPS